jgi:RNA polymerase sigma-70 factor, ECF subfamily
MSDPALDQQIRELLPQLRRFALWLTRDVAAADDLVQAALERALSRWTSRRQDEALRAWLFAILYRKFIDGRRRAQRYAFILERLRLSDEFARPSLEGQVAAQSALESLERLSAEQRTLLLWTAVEGLSYEEISRILEVPIGTVMSRLSRARQALRRLGEGEGDGATTPVLRMMK